MKKINKFIITSLVICFGILQATAGAVSTVSVSVDENNFIVLELDQANSRKIEVTILDHQGGKLFREIIVNKKAKSRKYDLRNLEYGDYLMQVDYGREIKILELTKSYKKLQVNKATQRTILKPLIESEHGFVDVNFLCFEGNFMVLVQDSSGNFIHKEQHRADGSFQTRYDLSNLPEGSYSFKIELVSKDFKGSFKEAVIITSDVVSL